MADDSSSKVESAMEKIKEKLRHDGDSDGSSSDSSDSDSEISSKVKSKIRRLFGRQKPVHAIFGGGKPADVILWRNKKISGGVLAGATAMWVLFELLEYNLLTLLCHILILSLTIIFLWANATIFINKSPPRLPELVIPKDVVVNTALAVRFEINRAFKVLRDIASGRELKKFLGVIAGLWVLSIVGGWYSFLTLFYIVFVLLHTVPVLYDKYEDQVDTYGERALAELKKQYAVFDARVLSKIPRGPLKNKKP